MDDLQNKYLQWKLKELEIKIQTWFYNDFINQEEAKRQSDYDRWQLDLIRFLLWLKK